MLPEERNLESLSGASSGSSSCVRVKRPPKGQEKGRFEGVALIPFPESGVDEDGVALDVKCRALKRGARYDAFVFLSWLILACLG